MAKKIIAAGGLVRNENNELLMILRKGHWDLPKGKMDAGETPEQCAVREVEEETGLQNIQLGEFISSTLHRYTENNEEIEKETFWYKMKVTGPQNLQPQAEENITDIHWVKNASLPEYLSQTYRNIRDIISLDRS
jgi:mutator protein MutT